MEAADAWHASVNQLILQLKNRIDIAI